MTCERLERDDLLGHLGEDMPHVNGCPDCKARLAGYNRLADLLAAESDRPLPDRWKERTLARIHGRRPRHRIAVAVAAAGAVAAVIAVLVLRPRPEKLEVSITRGPVQYRADSQPKPGDVLEATAWPSDEEHVEVRVYLEARYVMVRCPGAAPPICRTGDRIEVALPLKARGTYQVVWLLSQSPLPAPSGDLDADLQAARDAGADTLEDKPIDVN